jgi:polysaccharide chain length determinant protein (PEP-CTERM system associated)
MNVETGFELGDLKGIVRRRVTTVVGVALVCSLAAFWIAMALPNEYESYASVLVEPQAVDPDLVEAGVATADLNRRLHLMAAQILSRSRLSRIIDELSLYQDESNYLVRDEVINMMREHVNVDPVVPELEQESSYRREFTIDQFRLSFRDKDPAKARDVAQRLANDFIEEHIANRVRTSQKSLEFVEAELQRLAGAIQQVEARVAQLKSANPGRLPEDGVANQRRMERLFAELADVRREAVAARSDEAFFRSQGAAARDMGGLGARGDMVNTPAMRLRVLKLALAEFEARGLTDKHPDVGRAKREIAALEAVRASTAGEADEPNLGNFAEQSANAEAERARLRLSHSEQEVARIQAAMEGVQELLATAPAVAEQLDALQREYMHLFESYQDFSNRRLEAGVQADLERRQLGEQFRVLEAAFLAPEPVSPNRIVIVLIGIFFGLAMGGGIGIVLEAADSSIHTPRQLAGVLDLPVLAAIPEIWLETDRLRLRRKRIVTAFATVSLVAVGLVGGVANYWWVNGGLAVESEFGAPEASGGRGAPAPVVTAPEPATE